MVEVIKKMSEWYDENAKMIRKQYPKALIFDVTIDGAMKKLDPDFPIGGVRVPGMRKKSLSVRGVWEGLKVFKKVVKGEEEIKDVDEIWMVDEKKLGKRRGCKSWGKLIGIKVGEEEIGIEEGKEVVENIYREVVKERFGKVLESLRKESEKRPVILLDYKEEIDRPFNHVMVLKELICA